MAYDLPDIVNTDYYIERYNFQLTKIYWKKYQIIFEFMLY